MKTFTGNSKYAFDFTVFFVLFPSFLWCEGFISYALLPFEACFQLSRRYPCYEWIFYHILCCILSIFCSLMVIDHTCLYCSCHLIFLFKKFGFLCQTIEILFSKKVFLKMEVSKFSLWCLIGLHFVLIFFFSFINFLGAYSCLLCWYFEFSLYRVERIKGFL